MSCRILKLALLIFSSSSVYSQSHEVILGVLEDHAGVYVGDSSFRAVRMVFEKDGSSWQVPTSTKSPGEMTWSVGFDGKPLGQVTGRPRESKYRSEVGLQDVVGDMSIPTVGQRSADYGGFVGAPVYRPLIANSRPYFSDPDGWKPTQLTIGLISALRTQFRKKFPAVENCSTPEENVAKPWSYRDENIKILKSYVSKRGWRLARLRLEEYRCDGPADDEFADQWYVIDPGGRPSFLDQEMWLVDAGDYDNDGKSELVFSIDRYNRGGYELFYDDFKRHVVLEFGYH